MLRGVEKSETKTNSSMRTLPLEDHIYNYLVNIKKKQSGYEKLCGNSYNQKYKDYVCVNEMGDIIQPDYVTAKFRKILDRNGLKKIRFHDLRHSCVTLLMHLGYSQNEVRYWVGHSSTKMIDKVYAHFNMEDKRKMLSSISDVLQEK